MLIYKHKLYILLCVLLSINDAYSTHGAGLDISYKCLAQGANSDTYEITVGYYRDCSSPTSAGNIFLLEYSSSCNNGAVFTTISGPVFITLCVLDHLVPVIMARLLN